MRSVMRVLEQEGTRPSTDVKFFTLRGLARRVYGKEPTRAQIETVRQASLRLGIKMVRRHGVPEEFERRRHDGRVEEVLHHTTTLVRVPGTKEADTMTFFT